MFDVYDGLINWFTGLLLCVFTPVYPEPQAAVRSGRLTALERSDVIPLTWHAQLKIPILRLKKRKTYFTHLH